MGMQHEHEDYPQEEYGHGEEDHDHQQDVGEDQDHQEGHQQTGPGANPEILKIKLDIHLDRYEQTHDDDEGKSFSFLVPVTSA